MDPIVSLLKEDILPSDKLEAEKIWRKVPQFWLSEDQKLYKRFFSGPYLLSFILKNQSYFLRNYMREFAEVTQEEDLYLIELSHKAIGGRTCKKKHKSMERSVINAKDSHQTYTNREESLIPYPVLGRLHSGAWILLVLFSKQQVTRDICWSAQIISPSGSKLNFWRTLEM